MFQAPTLWDAGAGENPSWWPCPSDCRCPGGCAMDVTETDAAPFGMTDYANRCPFIGWQCLWPCPPSCQCPGECPMDVTETDAAPNGIDTWDVGQAQYAGQQWSWPWGEQNVACQEQSVMDFSVSYGQPDGLDAWGVGQAPSTGQQCSWPWGEQNVACQEQNAMDVTYTNAKCTGQVDTMIECMDGGYANSSDKSDGEFEMSIRSGESDCGSVSDSSDEFTQTIEVFRAD